MHKRACAIALILVSIGLTTQIALGATRLRPLETYRSALARVQPPPNVVFEYLETRIGPERVVTEKHLVYRNRSGDERNETVAVNGSAVVPAFVRIYHRDAWPYDASQFAVSADAYAATYAGTTIVGGRRTYRYAVVAASPEAFAITDLFIDVDRYLPVKESFSVSGSGCSGSGEIDFAPAAAYWMPLEIKTTCSTPGPSTSDVAGANKPVVYRESIVFGNYRFPTAIPSEIFVAPGAAAPAGE